MAIEGYANRFVCDLVAYEPGKPIDETARELGLRPEEIVKLASNENPLGASPVAREAMAKALEEAHIYPDGGAWRLRGALAEKYGLEPANVVVGNGSNEIIELLCHSFLNREAGLVAAEHAFVVYKLMATLFGARYIEVPDPGFVHDLDGMADAVDENVRLVFVANPNNPTGTMVSEEDLDRFIDRLPGHVVAVIDEAYFEYLDDPPDTLKYVRDGRNVCLLRTFSKAHGLAALRAGYGLAPANIAGVLQKARQPFNMNAIAQAGALGALADAEHAEKSRQLNRDGLKLLEGAFRERGINFVPSRANFVLAEVGEGDAVFQAMLKQGVIVRAMSGYKLPEWIRVTVGTPDELARCLQVLDKVRPGARV
jgi:histidinol-phosphate aminotransferase